MSPDSNRRRRIRPSMIAALVATSLTITPLMAPVPGLAQSGSAGPSPANTPPGPRPDQKKPSKKACRTAKKLLKEYVRLYEDVNKRPMPRKTRERLDRLRRAGTITSDDLPGSLMKKFPGELKGLTPKEINELCK